MSENVPAPRGDSDQMKRVCNAVADIVPDGTVFIVFTSFGGVFRYGSNGDRKDCINALKEWMIKAGAAEDWMKHL